MPRRSDSPHKSDVPRQPDLPATIPSPEQVRATAAEIRKSWTPRQRRCRRASLGGYLLLAQVLGKPFAAAASGPFRLRIKPTSRPSR